MTSTISAAAADASLAIGIAGAPVAMALAGGPRGARVLVTLPMVVRLAGGVVSLVLLGWGAALEAAVSILLSIAVLTWLWNREASGYFRPARPGVA